MLWAFGYGAVRVWWLISGTPSFGRLGFDLMFFSGPRAVALCVFALIVAVALRIAPWRWPLLAAAWTISVAHFFACPLLLLDFVGGLLPGMGVPFSSTAFLSRASCLVQGVLIAATAIAYRRRWRSDCLFCGRTGTQLSNLETPRWAWWAAYAAVGGCLIRLGAQLAIGFGMLHHPMGIKMAIEALLFEAAFLLAGTLLPLSLVHSWGRKVPRWVPFVADHRVPRWLPLGPAFVISSLMTVYFAITLAKIATITIGGNQESFGPFPIAFFWIAVPGYLIWGVGLGIAALSYYRVTRPKCRICGF